MLERQKIMHTGVTAMTASRVALKGAEATEDNAYRCYCYDIIKSSIEQCWSDRR